MVKYIWEFGSFIFFYLGTMHLVFTFFTNKFSSENKDLISQMKTSTPLLTKETTIWNAWVGFNASHGMGMIFIGITNIYLVHYHFEILGHFFFSLNIITVIFYLWLAKNYWFKAPFFSILITLLTYIITYIVTYL